MSSHNLNRKLEATVKQLMLGNEVAQALVDRFGNEAGQNIYAGVASGVKDLPCVIISAGGGTEEPLGSGIYTLALDVMVKTAFKDAENTDDELPKSSALVQAVGDCLNSLNLKDDINTSAVADFSVVGVFDRSHTPSIDEDAWSETFSMRCICVGFTAH